MDNSLPNLHVQTDTRISMQISKRSSGSLFSRRSVVVARDIISFVVGMVFFPVISIRNAVSEYRYRAKIGDSTAVSIYRAVRAFFIPVPIIGGVIRIAGQIFHRFHFAERTFNQTSCRTCLETENKPALDNILICIPFVGPGIVSVMLSHSLVPSIDKVGHLVEDIKNME